MSMRKVILAADDAIVVCLEVLACLLGLFVSLFYYISWALALVCKLNKILFVCLVCEFCGVPRIVKTRTRLKLFRIWIVICRFMLICRFMITFIDLLLKVISIISLLVTCQIETKLKFDTNIIRD